MSLRRHPRHAPRGPVVLAILDGIGRGAGDEADAVAIAATPTLDRLWVPGARAELCAHGKAVGLPSDDDMGNSRGRPQRARRRQDLRSGRQARRARDRARRAVRGPRLARHRRARRARRRRALPRPAQRRQRPLAHGPPRGAARRRRQGRLQAALPARPARRPRRRADQRAGISRPRGAVPRTTSQQRPRRADRQRRRPHDDHDGPLRGRLDDGGARLAHARARRRPPRSRPPRRPCRPRARRGRASSTRTCRRSWSSPPAPMQDGDACVLFNFRGDRAIEISRAFEGSDDVPVRPRPPPRRLLRRHDAVRRRPAHPAPLPRVAADDHRTRWASSSRARTCRSSRSARPRSTATSPTSGTATAAACSTTAPRPTSRSPATSCRSTSGRG